MLFRELLEKYSNEEIICKLHELYYKNQISLDRFLDPAINRYFNSLDELRSLDFSKSDHTIICEYRQSHEDNLESYYRIYLKEDNTEETFGAEFLNWNDFVGYKCNIQDISELDFIVHCLYEITFFGFTNEDAQSKVQELTNFIDDLEDHEIDEESQKWIDEM